VEPEPRRTGAKSASAFRTISEVGRELDIPQHVLRFWESKFNQVKPLKRGGGRRYYRPEDIALLRRIRDLLYTEGYTIRGVQRLFREAGVKAVVERTAENGVSGEQPVQETRDAAISSQTRTELEAVLSELVALRRVLKP
jgi:DNA-binding transcriptional MerR regulator